MKPYVEIEIVPGIQITVDQEDVERIKTMRWRLTRRNSSGFYFLASYRQNGRSFGVALPRFLLNVTGANCVRFLDFDDPHNYRKSNFEICSRREVTIRQRTLKTGRTSNYRGVHWNLETKTWRAQIFSKGQQIHLGSFDTEVEAAMAFNRAALEHFGERAHQNKI